jgi:hypothetical protein
MGILEAHMGLEETALIHTVCLKCFSPLRHLPHLCRLPGHLPRFNGLAPYQQPSVACLTLIQIQPYVFGCICNPLKHSPHPCRLPPPGLASWGGCQLQLQQQCPGSGQEGPVNGVQDRSNTRWLREGREQRGAQSDGGFAGSMSIWWEPEPTCWLPLYACIQGN